MNAIIEPVHGDTGKLMQPSSIDISETVIELTINYSIFNTIKSNQSIYHITLRSTSRDAIFGRNMLFGILCVSDWNILVHFRQKQMNKGIKHNNP